MQKKMSGLFSLLLIAFVTIPASAINQSRDSNFHSLVADHKAREIGDILTIIVLENATATTHAGTTTDKKTDSGFSLGFGKFSYDGSIGSNGFNSGTGSTIRAGSVKAQFTVKITGKTENGDLIVQGYQKIVFNKESQLINLTAEVRKEDIQADNTVLSNRLSNLQLSFEGEGKVSEPQKGSIFSAIFGLLGFL